MCQLSVRLGSWLWSLDFSGGCHHYCWDVVISDWLKSTLTVLAPYREVQQFHPDVRNSPEVNFAVQAFAALNSNNFVRFFKLVQSASYLNACLLHCYFNQVGRSTTSSIGTEAGTWSVNCFSAPVLFQMGSRLSALGACHSSAMDDGLSWVSTRREHAVGRVLQLTETFGMAGWVQHSCLSWKQTLNHKYYILQNA